MTTVVDASVVIAWLVDGEADGQETASLVHADLLELPIALVPYEPLAERSWALRGTLTSSDAAYVSHAERLDAPLATLDRLLVLAPGTTCEFLTPAA